MAGFNWFKRSYEEPEEPEKEVEEIEEAAAPSTQEDYLKWAKAAYQNIQERKGSSEGTADSAAPETEASSQSEPSEDEPSQSDAEAETVDLETVEIEPEAPSVAVTEVSRELGEEPDETTEVDERSPDEAESAPDEAAEPDELPEDESAEDESPTSEPISEVPIADAPVPVEATPDPDESAESESGSDSGPDSETLAVEAAPESAQPFWAKAQAEREERLERLKAEAILEPEPEPEPAPPEQAFVPLDIDLDEAFLWSAEVLASQGRRPDQISIEEITWLNKLRQGLDKTRRGLVNQLKSIVGQGPLNDEAVDEIESLLLQADVGVAATDKIISALQARLKEEVLPPEQAIAYLKSLLRDLLDAPLEGGHNLTFTPEKDHLSIWLMTGVNGAGKTTTIGKLTHIATKSGFKCLIGAADTFRAAAVEQVKVWGERSGVEVIANPGQNTDPAAVVFDAISAATSRGTELLLIDTAGRLQNKKNLMDELSKVRKIIDKKAPDANVESLLVLDATLGQNGLRQAQVFAEAAQLSGVVLTKLDGTARGGVALAVVQELGLPIRFIGAGEGIEDLRPFSSYEFVEALLNG
ncbi:MAG: signal recognition particle-docking protein FtsY [Phormidesmis sp.]